MRNDSVVHGMGISGWVRTGSLVLILGFLASSTVAQSFQNLDFERSGSPILASGGTWLSWSLAAPGWQHPKGGDSVFVYHQNPPVTSIAQYYALVDGVSSHWTPLEGGLSLALVSGHYNREDANSPWVKAYIEQQAFVPEDAQSFRLLADGNFSLTLNSQTVAISSLGNGLFGADVSGFAGQYATLRVTSEATEIQSPVIVDGMKFSTEPIPEPGMGALFGCGLVVMLMRRKSSGA